MLRAGFSVQGLTTAATIWMVSAIGLAIGEGLYLASIVTAGITLFFTLFLRKLEKKMPKLYSGMLTIVTGDTVTEDEIIAVLSQSITSIFQMWIMNNVLREKPPLITMQFLSITKSC